MHVWIVLILVIIVQSYFSLHVKTTFHKVEQNWIKVPQKAFGVSLAVATGLFTASSIIEARKSEWKGDDLLTVLCLSAGLFVGFTADLS
jgi:hypothetical protein